MKLRIQPAEGKSFEFAPEAKETIIGRSSTADLALSDPFLSRQHARLVLDDETLTVEDLGSRNGTFVNGVKLEQPTLLAPGDEIRLSASMIQVISPSRDSITRATTIESDPGATIFRPVSELLGSDAGSTSEHLDSTESLRQYAEKLEILKDIHEALAGPLDQDELLKLMLDRTFDHLKPQQAVVYLREDDGEFYQAATRALPGMSTTIPLSHALVAEVLDKGMAALVFDVMTDKRFAASESILMSGVRSMIAAPLLAEKEGALGMIVLNSTIATRQFTEADMELLVSLASVAALKIRNAALAEEAAQTRVLEMELEKARTVQMELLSRELPKPEGYRLLGTNIPSRGVSGDFYQVIGRREEQECVIFLADVSGKGVDASLLTMLLDGLVAAPVALGDPADEICVKLSEGLYERSTPAKYATAFVAILEYSTGKLIYTNAGHNSALLISADGELEELPSCGMPIGLLPVSGYEARETRLDPGATLLIYTDGITEAESPAGEEYGLERLRACTSRFAGDPPEKLVDEINDDLQSFAQHVPFADDRTMVIVQRT